MSPDFREESRRTADAHGVGLGEPHGEQRLVGPLS